jgi:hypothetical protein
MSISTLEPPVRATSSSFPDREKRILVPNESWKLYKSFVEQLPERTPIRVAFDGRDVEIMVKGPVHH